MCIMYMEMYTEIKFVNRYLFKFYFRNTKFGVTHRNMCFNYINQIEV